MKVRSVMVNKVVTIRDNSTFPQIVSLLVENKISGAPVVNKKGKVVGIISEKDLIVHLFPDEKEFYKNMEYYTAPGRIEEEAKKITKLKAKDLMTKDVISTDPENSVMTACAVLLINNIRRLPVMENGKIVGIVTTKKLYKNFLKSLL
jgi:CBS domain-containing protein